MARAARLHAMGPQQRRGGAAVRSGGGAAARALRRRRAQRHPGGTPRGVGRLELGRCRRRCGPQRSPSGERGRRRLDAAVVPAHRAALGDGPRPAAGRGRAEGQAAAVAARLPPGQEPRAGQRGPADLPLGAEPLGRGVPLGGPAALRSHKPRRGGRAATTSGLAGGRLRCCGVAAGVATGGPPAAHAENRLRGLRWPLRAAAWSR
mmetsp:Transcript_54127/g.150161  ORF Transcript_54127/g.150161 Transcript_54127/m.150161 type:complete len:206 (-) Transcript_54127:42-659(-)